MERVVDGWEFSPSEVPSALDSYVRQLRDRVSYSISTVFWSQVHHTRRLPSRMLIMWFVISFVVIVRSFWLSSSHSPHDVSRVFLYNHGSSITMWVPTMGLGLSRRGQG